MRDSASAGASSRKDRSRQTSPAASPSGSHATETASMPEQTERYLMRLSAVPRFRAQSTLRAARIWAIVVLRP